jgi:hypothetical protein
MFDKNGVLTLDSMEAEFLQNLVHQTDYLTRALNRNKRLYESECKTKHSFFKY